MKGKKLSRSGDRSQENDRAITRRDALKGALGLGAMAALSSCAYIEKDAGSVTKKSILGQADLIRLENQKPGTREWRLTNTRVDPATRYRCPWIEGYCSRTSVRAGEQISFHVSTNPPSPFTLEIYRMGFYGGAGGRLMRSYEPLKGATQPDPPIGEKRLRDCQWEPSVTVKIPKDWLSGVYLGKLTSLREGIQSYLIFIVRDERPADLIVQCSDTTWQAYNRWPSQFALYDDGKDQWYWGPNVQVGFNRPYGKYCQILDAPLSTGSGEWFLWEYPLAYWLESRGYDVTYLSNLDTHAEPNGLMRAKGFLSVGHDEYWSMEMFRGVKAAIDSGLNVAFLSGNAVCGRIRFSSDSGNLPNRAFERVGVFGPPGGTRDFVAMKSLSHERPYANELVGAHSTGPVTGGADWICAQPDHWLFEGTGMKQGEGIPGLVGWEWHGDPAPIPGLEVVATGPTQEAPGKLNGGVFTATIYPGPKGNFVFNAATCWWADGLSEPPGYVRPSAYTTPKGPDTRAQQIMVNLLERLKRVRATV
jgi:hypothetical protein